MMKISRDMAQQKGANPNVANLLIGGFAEVYAKGLAKESEFEADRMGVVIAARAGYDPYGLPNVLQMLQTLQARDSQDAGSGLLFATHPPFSARISLLNDLMPATFDRFDGLPILADRFKAEMSKAIGKTEK